MYDCELTSLGDTPEWLAHSETGTDGRRMEWPTRRTTVDPSFDPKGSEPDRQLQQLFACQSKSKQPQRRMSDGRVLV